jgi:hypothetical protein
VVVAAAAAEGGAGPPSTGTEDSDASVLGQRNCMCRGKG